MKCQFWMIASHKQCTRNAVDGMYCRQHAGPVKYLSPFLAHMSYARVRLEAPSAGEENARSEGMPINAFQLMEGEWVDPEKYLDERFSDVERIRRSDRYAERKALERQREMEYQATRKMRIAAQREQDRKTKETWLRRFLLIATKRGDWVHYRTGSRNWEKGFTQSVCGIRVYFYVTDERDPRPKCHVCQEKLEEMRLLDNLDV